MIYLTEAAINAFNQKLEERNTPNAYIRVGVKGNGCKGFRHVIQFEDGKPRDKDHQFFFNGIRVLVDPKSMTHITDSIVDWKESLMKRGFVVNNPNIKSSCGCGESFDTKVQI